MNDHFVTIQNRLSRQQEAIGGMMHNCIVITGTFITIPFDGGSEIW